MLQALHSAGLRVPEDVYLTGLDDDNTQSCRMQRLQHGIIPAAHKVDDRLRRGIPTGHIMQQRIQRFRIFNRRKENILLRPRNAELLAGVTEAALSLIHI